MGEELHINHTKFTGMSMVLTLGIQVCPKKGINPTILLWGWDWDHQTYSRERYESLGISQTNHFSKINMATTKFRLMGARAPIAILVGSGAASGGPKGWVYLKGKHNYLVKVQCIDTT